MTDNELKKLNRRELLEILIEQGSEIDRLKEELKSAREQLADRSLNMENAGSIAEASLALSGVFNAAQAAADQYLENIRKSEIAIREKEEEAERRSAQIIADAEAKADECAKTAVENVRRYWDEVSRRLENFYSEHQGLKELLAAGGLNSGKL